ncbi:hypothetical protein C8R47DRAFT_1164038 [Mycena vitilis]|nr:hypothetical protein C8R47DRAFT_1164038 [Mycena vitilis]
MLKALSDDSKREKTNKSFYMVDGILEHICALPPSENLVPLIRQASPWCAGLLVNHSGDKRVQSFISWLKKIERVPKDLIRRWEAYETMSLLATIREDDVGRVHFDFMHITPISPDQLDTLHGDMSGSSVSLAACHRLVNQCPTLVYMLQALWLLNNGVPKIVYRRVDPIFIQLLLGLSWDDLTTDLTVLRSLIGGAAQKQIDCAVMIMPTVLALSVEVYPHSIPYLTTTLARRALHLVQQVVNETDHDDHHFPIYDWRHLAWRYGFLRLWGQLIRQSPHSSPELLRELREFVLHRGVFCPEPAEKFNHVVQWLKVHTYTQCQRQLCLTRAWPGRLSRIHQRTCSKCSSNGRIICERVGNFASDIQLQKTKHSLWVRRWDYGFSGTH